MTDFFHENAYFENQGEVLSRIAHTSEHTFLLLTKRPERAYKRYHTPLPNVWLGVTVCNQEEADEKMPLLMKIPAAKRFVSVEPMLEAITLPAPLPDWVICGAETGSGARTMSLQWARDLRNQCREAAVPFFFKKAGNKIEIADDLMVREFPQ